MRNSSRPESGDVMRVLICTVVHHVSDARIFRRQIGALREASIDVTVIAPFASSDLADPHLQHMAIPRAVGRHRFASWRAARARISAMAAHVDALLIHDPELLIVIPWRELRRMNVRVIWDVHEDLGAALAVKTYIPAPLRQLLVPAVHLVERLAERRATLFLAEVAYSQRFRKVHTKVLNLPLVPEVKPTGVRKRQAIYVGSITRERGLDTMLAMADSLAAHGVGLRLIGEVPNTDDRERVREALNVSWDGPLPNADAMHEVEASMVGLALLQDLPNYRHSMPTKILEYMASGTAVVATPLPLSREVLGSDGVVLSGFDDPVEAVHAVVALCDDDTRRERITENAYLHVRDFYNWNIAKHSFVAAVRAAANR